MPAYRFPILTFRDAAGAHTAVLVEDSGDVAAYGQSPSEAVGRLRDFLEWHYRQHDWLEEPDFRDPVLAFQKVEVRPEYVINNRPYPCGETVPLRVPVVSGKTGTGLLVAALPTFSIRFTYFAPGDLKALVAQYVQGQLRGQTPAQIARHLAPEEVALDDVVITVPREPRSAAPQPETGKLQEVADPLAGRELRARFSRAWEREDLVGRLVEALRRERAPVLLVGETGAGKTTVLADAARRIEREGLAIGPAAAGEEDEAVASGRRGRAPRFWLTSAPRIIAGMQYLGMWQERVEEVISELGTISGVLCAENLLDLVRTGGRSPADSIAAFLVPYLQRSELRLVAEATPAELDAVRRQLPGLADLFHVVAVPPFTRGQALAALSHVATAHRQNLHVEYDRAAIDATLRLFARFMPYQPFPGRSVHFLGELFDRAARAGGTAARVTADDAVDLFVRHTGLPELFLRDELPLAPEAVTAALAREVIGQERACRTAAWVVTTFKAGLNDPARPLGVLLFCGPTGVGKTQLAQSLARLLFGGRGASEDGRWKMEDGQAIAAAAPSSAPRSAFPQWTMDDGQWAASAAGDAKGRLIRLDMSEYAGLDAADRFLGTAHGGPSEWVQKVRRQPFCVLLLDEIEKASPDLFDVLLGVFDEGRLTDPWGRLTYLRSAVIIMTSNLGAGAGEPFGLNRANPAVAAGPAYESEARGFFRPEFYNRIDAVVPFEALSEPVIRAITEKELGDLARREGLERSGLRLAWTEGLVAHLAREGFDPRYGARPLQRALETVVVTPLARYLVANPGLRNATLRLDVDGGELLVVSC